MRNDLRSEAASLRGTPVRVTWRRTRWWGRWRLHGVEVWDVDSHGVRGYLVVKGGG